VSALFCVCGHEQDDHEAHDPQACIVIGCDCEAFDVECSHEDDGEGTCLGCGADLTR
jgi:hypothetical protein